MTTNWTLTAEGGGRLLPRLLISLALRAGWLIRYGVLPCAAGWYMLTDPAARKASTCFLRRALGRAPRLADVYRHFHSFASVILDRVFLLSGKADHYQITVQGLEHLHHHARTGAGALIFGAHLGSFESLRALTSVENCPVPVRPLMWRGHTRGLTAALERLSPEATQAIIDIGRASTALDVQAALRQGELVGLLADRAHLPQRMVGVPFLGKTAYFPAGPFLLASATAVPVLLCFGLRTGLRRYTIIVEPFAERITLPRRERLEAIRRWLLAYTGRLEHYARAYPYNWFNFYDFWQTGPAGANGVPRRDAPLADDLPLPADNGGSAAGFPFPSHPIAKPFA